MPATLVTIGDSLTQGFQHGAIRRSDWSYPAMLAHVLQIPNFRLPDFSGEGVGGPLLDIELLSRKLSNSFGAKLNWWELPSAFHLVRSFMDQAEDYWERDAGTQPSNTGPLHHNLAVWGFEVLDALTLSDGVCLRNTKKPKDNFLSQIPEFGMYRTARRVLNPSQLFALEELTQLSAAKKIADEEGGIKNVLIALGANNALATCLSLTMRWSQSADFRKLAHQRNCTIWEPEHFKKIYDQLVLQTKQLNAKRVFLATVPHVTSIPVVRGISPRGRRLQEREVIDGYYEYYTHFWVWDRDFNPEKSLCLTREDAKNIDSAIDEYNAHIKAVAQENGWHIIDFCKTLDKLSFRAKQGKITYTFPPELINALQQNYRTTFRVRPDNTVLLDTRYFQLPSQPPKPDAPSKDWQMAFKGGLIGLDGVHPTTIGYGLMAHDVLSVMKQAGVPHADPAQLNWDKIVAADSLVTNPPVIFSALRDTLGFLFSRAKLDRLIRKLSGYGSQGEEDD